MTWLAIGVVLKIENNQFVAYKGYMCPECGYKVHIKAKKTFKACKCPKCNINLSISNTCQDT